MTRTAEMMQQIADLTGTLHRDWREVHEALSLADRAVSDIYHRVENATFNAAEGYALARELQAALRRRRAIKNERDTLQAASEWVNAQHMVTFKLAGRLTTLDAEQQAWQSAARSKHGAPAQDMGDAAD